MNSGSNRGNRVSATAAATRCTTGRPASSCGLELDLASLKEDLGVDDVICKPISPKALVARVQDCLNERANLT